MNFLNKYLFQSYKQFYKLMFCNIKFFTYFFSLFIYYKNTKVRTTMHGEFPNYFNIL